MEKTDVIKKRFSDLIEDKYKSWKDTRIILDGGTGSGKTYFVLNKIGKYAKECNCKILYLCNRSKLRDQTYGDIKTKITRYGYSYDVSIITEPN